MKKWISILGGLLAVQLIVAVAVNVSDQDYGAFEAKEKLLGFDKQKVNRLLIEDDKESVTLRKSAGQWVLPDADDFPAMQKSVDDLLDKLAGLEKGWPVATTSGASRRFRVADDDYEHRVTLYAGDEVAARLYIGTSPGFRKVHIRPEREDAVFVAELNAWEVDTQVDAWIDKGLLGLDDAEVAQVDIAGKLSLKNQAGELQLVGLAEQETTNSEAARSLIDKLSKLRIESLKSGEEAAKYTQQDPVLDISVALKDGRALRYRFYKEENESNYLLKRSDMDSFFEIASYSVDPLRHASREKLVVVKEPQKEAVSDIKTTQNQLK
jgi:hypothetical protein